MKKYLLLLLFVPLLAIGQQENWLTPYANVEFKDSLIIYSVSSNVVMTTHRLMPKLLDKRLLQVKITPTKQNVSSEDVFKSREAIEDYLATEPVTLRSSTEQEEYLRLAAMVVIWEQKLSPFTEAELSHLTKSSDTSISNHAELVVKLLEFYKNAKI